ncbi:MAG: hypothetical protein A3I11_07685 [Elusimicrobia bacterium RIFCSPLOWO2_02_FULL_39_32]|nr:MAG: hypothetical protein A2034_05225 [Elusimicrobia bacterium GWA2_38_7]OGR79737.1 MAG: hypothetical protein A3B80_01015 [Elusimicrobia bacterium RIFCSPHIGHO2_02_FULL_39_36]OGR92066.1 MAG: hypothetical protein A3I11_07685 [Elusimicrobia bacterium RIFCSPLOWO2_02_FULL_39_32]OGR98644.1 MAG: hypothetical protein A3G85_04745 [Elusimicrobia bacterium RIFCSPLOWO2_12_FULL_39_28]
MAKKEFIRLLDPENRIRIKFETKRGNVHQFSVQYEALIETEWTAIVRYDTAHGFTHRDILMPDGSARKESIDLEDFGSALTYAQEDLLRNWERYKEDYLGRIKK